VSCTLRVDLVTFKLLGAVRNIL